MVFAICDDDRTFVEDLKQHIIESFEKTLQIEFYLFYNGATLIKALLVDHIKFDAIFLDVLLPDRNGMSIAQQLRRQDITAPIIFISTSSDYCPDGYFVEAISYIVKPHIKLQLDRSLNKLMKQLEKTEREFLYVCVENQESAIPFSEILTIEKYGRKTAIKCLNSVTTYTNQAITQLIDQIQEHSYFVVYSYSNYVNIGNIFQYDKGGASIKMKDGSMIYPARSQIKKVLEAFIRRNGG